MGYGAGVNLCLFALSALGWLQGGAHGSETQLMTLFATLAALFFLRHVYQPGTKREPILPYLGIGAAVCVVAALLLSWASAGVHADQEAEAAELGSVTASLKGGPDAGMDEGWYAFREVVITTVEGPYTSIALSIADGSSTSDIDAIVLEADGTEVLCESEKRVNWQRVGGAIRLDLNCETAIPYSELTTVRGVRLYESGGYGWAGFNPQG